MNLLRETFLVGLIVLSAVFCFGQTQPKASPKPAPASSGAAQETKSQAKPAEEEAIPPAAPGAIFPAVVARVNGSAILGRDLETLVRQELAEIGSPEWKNLREEYRGELIVKHLTSLINSRLLYEKAVASGTKVTDAEVKAELERVAKNYQTDAEFNAALASQNIDRAGFEKNLYRSLMMSKFVDETINKKIVVTDDELAKYYSSNPTQFSHPDIVRTSHILIRPAGPTAQQDALAKERAEGILARIKKGEDFAKLAKEYSVDMSASQGGDVGFAAREDMAPEYADAAFSLPVGGIKLVKTELGYHILKVTDKKKEGLAPLNEVKEELADFLKRQKSQAELEKLVNELRKDANIEILISPIQRDEP